LLDISYVVISEKPAEGKYEGVAVALQNVELIKPWEEEQEERRSDGRMILFA